MSEVHGPQLPTPADVEAAQAEWISAIRAANAATAAEAAAGNAWQATKDAADYATDREAGQ